MTTQAGTTTRARPAADQPEGLEAYRASFADRSDMLVLDPQSDFFRYFQGAEPAPAASGRQPTPPFKAAPAAPAAAGSAH